MKNITRKILQFGCTTAVLLGIGFLHGQTKDPVKAANASNEKKADANIIEADIAGFLVKSADARMMDAQEGKLAAKRGTTAAVRNYGALMVKDQAMLLKKIKALAAARKISLPTTIGQKKAEGKEDLQKKTGKDFDKKFIKMMKIDHERDVKLFKKAQDFRDPAVSGFAREWLPMIQQHLDGVNKLAAQ